jgi:tetratricopeptide (TPR) repeat protein
MALSGLSELEEELRQDPRSRRFFDLAREYQRLGRIEAAQDLCEKGLAAYPNHWQARLLLGQIYVTKGKLDDGRQMVEKVLLAFHDSVPANHLAADIYWAMGERDKALKHYQIVDLLQPGQAGVSERLADLQAPSEAIPEGAEPLAPGMKEIEPLDDLPAAAVPALDRGPQPLPSPVAPRWQEGRPAIDEAPPPVAPDAPTAGEPEALWVESGAPDSELDADTASFSSVLDPGDELVESAPSVEAALPTEEPALVRDSLEHAEQLPPLHDQAAILESPPGLNTFTLAELYEKQGYPEKAVEIYQRMLLHQPDNLAIHSRIRDLMARMAGEVPEAPAVHQEDVEKAMRHKRVLVLQGWLRRVREGRHV